MSLLFAWRHGLVFMVSYPDCLKDGMFAAYFKYFWGIAKSFWYISFVQYSINKSYFLQIARFPFVIRNTSECYI